MIKKGRPKKNSVTNTRIVAGQVEPNERQAIEALTKRTGRTLSYVVRFAILRLLLDDAAGNINWANGLDAEEIINGSSH